MQKLDGNFLGLGILEVCLKMLNRRIIPLNHHKWQNPEREITGQGCKNTEMQRIIQIEQNTVEDQNQNWRSSVVEAE